MSSFLFFPTLLEDPATARARIQNQYMGNPFFTQQQLDREVDRVIGVEEARKYGVLGSKDNRGIQFGEGYEIALGAVLFILALLPFMTGHTEGTTFEWGLVMTIMYSTIGLFLYVYFRRVPKGGRVTVLDKYSNIDINSPVKIFQAILYYYFFAPAKFAANVFYILEMVVRKLFGYKHPGEQTTSLKTFDFYQNTLSSIKMRIQPYIDSSELLRILFVGPAYAKRRTLFSEDPIERTYNGPVNREVLLSTIILAVCVTVPAVITAARGEEMSRSYVKYSYGTIAVVSLIIFLLVYGTLQGYSSEILNKISGNMADIFPDARDAAAAHDREVEIELEISELQESLNSIRLPNGRFSEDDRSRVSVIQGKISRLQRQKAQITYPGVNWAANTELVRQADRLKQFQNAT